VTFAENLLSKPHAVAATMLAALLLGVIGFFAIPTNMFPDTNRPMVSVVVPWRGALSTDVANEVTHPLEVRLKAVDGVRRVTSTSRDEVGAVQVEFEYGIDISSAANAVTTELSRVKGLLPRGINDPLVFKITDAAHPVMVLAITAAPASGLNLAQVRAIVAHDLRDALLSLPGVAEAEVFGGPVRQLSVDLDRNRLAAYQLQISQVIAALVGSNLSVPAGLIQRKGNQYQVTTQALAITPEDLAAVLVPLPGGDFVRVSDLGKVNWGAADPVSLYHGNGKEAVAVSLLRSERGFAKPVIETVNASLESIAKQFPNLQIEIADSQGRIIDLTVDNMLSSLRDAIIMTVFVILLFLGNTRAATVVALSLPISYILTFAALWWIGFEFDMVTLSAIIIAVGLLADDVVVVMENIERRMQEMGESGKVAAVRGLDEILLADTAGTISTIIVLVPIMLIGGFVQTVLRPLSITLAVALAASLVVSVTMIPLLAPLLLRPGARDPLAWLLKPFSRYVLQPLKNAYVDLVRWGLRSQRAVVLLFVGLLVVAGSHLRLQGRELMPLMDTGIVKISFEAAPDTGATRMKVLSGQVESAIRAEIPENWLLSLSTVVGSEPGVKSFGAARLLQQGETIMNVVDRFQRDRTIYDINSGIRQRLRQIPGLISANVAVFGATPLSSIRASLDIMISGADPAELDALATEVMSRLQNVPGLTGMERSWQRRSEHVELNVDPALARLYGLTAGQVATQVAQAVGGAPAGRVRVPGNDPIPIWVRLQPDQRSSAEAIRGINIRARNGGLVPLSAMAHPRLESAPTAETHQDLVSTVDVLAFRRNVAITALHEQVVQALADLQLPRGYRIRYEGENKQLAESFTRLGIAFSIGLLLLYFMLVVTFDSFLDPLAVMITLPLALIGAGFGVVLGGKFGSMPAFMGMILLMGIVVNNGILLVDFAKQALRQGEDLEDAILEAVRKRTRPILMTALASAVGMIPLAMEWAVGIERLSPLAFVAIGGLLTGTFLTLLAVPLLFERMERLRRRFGFSEGNRPANPLPAAEGN